MGWLAPSGHAGIMCNCSSRYLFFFHRRPEHGPMRVQLTNPVSRFKHIQSLQHMCRYVYIVQPKRLYIRSAQTEHYVKFEHCRRFVIRKTVVRKDLIQTLPLPRRLLDYVGYKNCFSEHLEGDSLQVSDYDIRERPRNEEFNAQESIDRLFHLSFCQTADGEEHMNNGQQRRHHHQEEPPTEASPIAIEPAETIDIDDDTAL